MIFYKYRVELPSNNWFEMWSDKAWEEVEEELLEALDMEDIVVFTEDCREFELS